MHVAVEYIFSGLFSGMWKRPQKLEPLENVVPHGISRMLFFSETPVSMKLGTEDK